jgi:hypothetical protein
LSFAELASLIAAPVNTAAAARCDSRDAPSFETQQLQTQPLEAQLKVANG